MSIDLIESDLRAAFAAQLTGLDDGADARLAGRDYHPRTRRRGPVAIAAGSTAVAALATAAALAGGGSDRATPSAQPSPVPAPSAARQPATVQLAGYRFQLPPGYHATADNCGALADGSCQITVRFSYGTLPPPGSHPLLIDTHQAWSTVTASQVAVTVAMSSKNQKHTLTVTAHRVNGSPTLDQLVAMIRTALAPA